MKINSYLLGLLIALSVLMSVFAGISCPKRGGMNHYESQPAHY
jgi:hypothetical protein